MQQLPRIEPNFKHFSIEECVKREITENVFKFAEKDHVKASDTHMHCRQFSNLMHLLFLFLMEDAMLQILPTNCKRESLTKICQIFIMINN